jgi:asparagine synthase (glutamine-hydrolysing)
MSIILGVRKDSGIPIVESELRQLALATDRYASDRSSIRVDGEVGMCFQPHLTHQRLALEIQPAVDRYGNMLTFDGRLDNQTDLSRLLGLHGDETSDSRIVLAAFERWGDDCFSRFVGDWALALWWRERRSLYLARDHAGMRTLYFEIQADGLRWATYLDTFLAANESRSLDDSYAARYLGCLPTENLTPYKGVTAVTPAHYFVFRHGNVASHAHWLPIAKNRLLYKTDLEYEEHFRQLFAQSVKRRTGAGAPILAQLSGGLDSSSIVCMSDHIRRKSGATPEELLDTISYTDEADSNWSEEPFYSSVERDRGKVGTHLCFPLLSDGLLSSPVRYLVPGADRATYENEARLEEKLGSQDYRILLSGMGGDELLGGVPTPLPELADYLFRLEIGAYTKRAMAWCLIDRTPFLHLNGRTVKFLVNQYIRPGVAKSEALPWSTAKLHKLMTAPVQIPRWGGPGYFIPPSSLWNGTMWWALLDTLPHLSPGHIARREYRYPYLDRDLVEFLFRVPRERLLQPGRRRSMMRSALRGVVPVEVLERRRKASRRRAVLAPLQSAPERIREVLRHSTAEAIGLVDASCAADLAPHLVHGGDPQWVHALTRLLLFELWRPGSGSDAQLSTTAA